jgi:hypothetical protein
MQGGAVNDECGLDQEVRDVEMKAERAEMKAERAEMKAERIDRSNFSGSR